MEWLINIVYYVVPFIILLGVLVFVHEMGHFLAARWSGVKVDEFSIGFGKELWGRTDKKGTHWKVGAVPLGGYCKFLGDGDETSSTTGEAVHELSEAEKKFAFPYQSPFKKLFIVLAGPGANYLFAILILASIFYFIGKITFPPVVGEVVQGGAAEAAGIQAGDRILTINNRKINDFSDVTREVELNAADQINVELSRDGKKMQLSFPLKKLEVEGIDGQKLQKAMLGVRSLNSVEVMPQRISLGEAIADAGKETWRITEMTLRGVGQIFTGRRSSEELGGIIRIAEMSGDISKKSGAVDFLIFMALLSINLGLINLFPIPLLDGGHVVIYVIEIIKGKELNERIKDVLFKFGLGIIVSLMLFATWNDFVRLFHRWFS